MSSMPSSSASSQDRTLYGGVTSRRVTVRDIAAAKVRGERWAMLTAYDALTASVFDEAGIPVLLVGDSAANTVLGYETTVPVTLDEMVVLTKAVVRGTRRSLVVGDLPFGTYRTSPAQALTNAGRLLQEGGAQAVKLEGGRSVTPQVEALVAAGIPVMGHIGLTPQSVNTLGGFPVQGRGEGAAELLADAKALEAAGAFAVVLELIPAELAARITAKLTIPTVGIGAGNGTDAQVLVWTDMAGLTSGRMPRFVKKYADLRTVLGDAARAYQGDVLAGAFPAEEHSVH